MPSAPDRSARLVVTLVGTARVDPDVVAHRTRIGAALRTALPAARTPIRADEAARIPASAARVQTSTDAVLGGFVATTAFVDVSGSVGAVGMRSRTPMLGRLGFDVVVDDGDLAGQFGDGHRIGVAAATATARREPGRRACRSWPTTRQPRWVGCCRLVRSFLVAIPIDSLTTSIPHGSLDEGGSVSFAIEFAQDEAFP